MGKVYSSPKFFELDYSRIEVLSASKEGDFYKYRIIQDFGKDKGKFLIDDDNENHCIFEKENGDFVEFNIL